MPFHRLIQATLYWLHDWFLASSAAYTLSRFLSGMFYAPCRVKKGFLLSSQTTPSQKDVEKQLKRLKDVG